jgi:hypothetical protein
MSRRDYGRCEAKTQLGPRCSRTARTIVGHGHFCVRHARLGWVGYSDGRRTNGVLTRQGIL